MMAPSPRIPSRADMLRRLVPAAAGVAHVHATNIFWSQVMHMMNETTSTLDARPVNVCHDWSAGSMYTAMYSADSACAVPKQVQVWHSRDCCRLPASVIRRL